jgi:hypothetical protein
MLQHMITSAELAQSFGYSRSATNKMIESFIEQVGRFTGTAGNLEGLRAACHDFGLIEQRESLYGQEVTHYIFRGPALSIALSGPDPLRILLGRSV